MSMELANRVSALEQELAEVRALAEKAAQGLTEILANFDLLEQSEIKPGKRPMILRNLGIGHDPVR